MNPRRLGPQCLSLAWRGRQRKLAWGDARIKGIFHRLAAIVKPYDGGVLKIMGAKAFRSPSVYELHYTAPFQLAPTKLSP